ncbi:MAG: hypothetical protein M1269_11980 [Chloroflexi bacterium]|nr:hypothetical protein [Chloroflexota bacterium]
MSKILSSVTLIFILVVLVLTGTAYAGPEIKSVIMETISFPGETAVHFPLEEIYNGIERRAALADLKITIRGKDMTHFIIDLPESREGWPLVHYLIDKGAFEIQRQDDGKYHTVIDNSDIKEVTIKKHADKGSEKYILRLSFTAEGEKKYAKAVSDNIGKQLFFKIDKKLVLSPMIEEAYPGGEITGAVFNDEISAKRAKAIITGKPYPCLLQVTEVEYYRQ